MLASSLPVLVLAGFVSRVSAHGYVPQIKIGNEYYPGWDVSTDGYANPPPVRPVRATKPDSGFISDVTSGDITCSIGNANLPNETMHLDVAAGEIVTAMWNTWPIGHFGPIMNYMAKCPDAGCTGFKADEGSPWFKIQQDTFDASTGIWPSDVLASSNFTYDITVPKNIESGYYLLRHENLALHGGGSLGGAQFYPVCIQLSVSGGGTLAPNGLSFPGEYDAEDSGILYNVYVTAEENAKYVPPGGDVYPGLN